MMVIDESLNTISYGAKTGKRNCNRLRSPMGIGKVKGSSDPINSSPQSFDIFFSIKAKSFVQYCIKITDQNHSNFTQYDCQ